MAGAARRLRSGPEGRGAELLSYYPPKSEANSTLKFAGKDLGKLPLKGAPAKGVLFVDPTGARCYELRELRYSQQGAAEGGVVSRKRFAKSALHRLPKRPDFWLTPIPDRIEVSMGQAWVSRWALVDLKCR